MRSLLVLVVSLKINLSSMTDALMFGNGTLWSFNDVGMGFQSSTINQTLVTHLLLMNIPILGESRIGQISNHWKP